MAAKMSVLGLLLSSYPYLRSAMVRFPLSHPFLPTGSWRRHSQNVRGIKIFLIPEGHQNPVSGSKVLRKGGILPFAGVPFGRVWACSRRSWLVNKLPLLWAGWVGVDWVESFGWGLADWTRLHTERPTEVVNTRLISFFFCLFWSHYFV